MQTALPRSSVRLPLTQKILGTLEIRYGAAAFFYAFAPCRFSNCRAEVGNATECKNVASSYALKFDLDSAAAVI